MTTSGMSYNDDPWRICIYGFLTFCMSMCLWCFAYLYRCPCQIVHNTCTHTYPRQPRLSISENRRLLMSNHLHYMFLLLYVYYYISHVSFSYFFLNHVLFQSSFWNYARHSSSFGNWIFLLIVQKHMRAHTHTEKKKEKNISCSIEL